VEDASRFADVATYDDIDHYTPVMGAAQPSSLTDYPSNYKIVGVELLVNFDLKELNRAGKDQLTYMGECGGFFLFLYVIGLIVVCSYYASRVGRTYMAE
jgi:hypothetical protein